VQPRWVIAVLIGAFLLLPACSRSTPTGGVISGHLVMVGGPANAWIPVSGPVSVDGSDLTFSIGSDGSYSIRVPAGRHVLTGRSPLYGAGAYECDAPKPVVVVTGG
jgi:hypothetical protein